MESLRTFLTNLTASKKALLLLTPILTVLLSMKEALLGLVLLIFIDLITGIKRNQKEWGIKTNPLKIIFWKSIKSYLLRKTWKKIYEYGLGILVIVVFETFIFGKVEVPIHDRNFSISELSIIFPAIVELWSIFENIESYNGTNLLKKLVNFLPAQIKALFSVSQTKNVENNGKV